MSKSTKIFKYIFWSFIFLLLFIIQFSHCRLDSDNGIFLTGAWNLANNLDIYKDFFSFTAPGSYYLILFVWKTFGISFWSAWVTGFIFLSISVWLVYKLAVYINNKVAPFAVLMFTLSTSGWPLISSHVFVLPFILGSIYLAMLGADRRRINLVCWSALSAGIAILFLQTVGLAVVAAVFIFLLIIFYKQRFFGAHVLFIYLIISFLPVALLFLKWSPVFLFDKLVKFPFYNYATVIPLDYLLLICIAIFLTVIYLILIKRQENKSSVQFLYIAEMCLLVTTVSFPDYAHISFIYVPLLILFPLLVVEFICNHWKEFYYLKIVLIVYFFIFFLVQVLMVLCFSGFTFLTLKSNYIPLVNYVNENCEGKYIYAGPFIPEMYFETRRFSPGPADWLLTGSEEYYELTVQGIINNKPDCALLEYEKIKKFDYDKDNKVDNYINDNYNEVNLFGKVHVLKRVK